VLLAKSDKVFFVLGGCLFVLGLGLRLFAWRAKNPINKKLFRRSAKLFDTIGILEVLWFGMRYENVRFFGTHFVALLCLLIGLVWLGFLVHYFFTAYPNEKRALEKQQLKEKYLR
jgi:Ca2+/Na+ antiporter